MSIESSRLQARALELVRHRPRTVELQHIADATGIKVSWLKQFTQGKIKEAGVVKVEALYTFLNRAPLEV
jgi:hypothetical protein